MSEPDRTSIAAEAHMRADERPDPTDTQGDDAEKVEQLEDLEAGEDDASAVKGGGPKEQQSMPGGDPTD